MALCAFGAFAQEGEHVVLRYKPENIEILPGVYEFFGTISGGADDRTECYALSVNEDLVAAIKDSLTKGKPQVLFGPRLEPLVQEKVIAEYQKKRNDIEKGIQDSISNTSIFKKAKYDLKKHLKDEQANTVAYVARLKKITERTKVRCIYIYGCGGPSQDFTPADTQPEPVREYVPEGDTKKDQSRHAKGKPIPQ